MNNEKSYGTKLFGTNIPENLPGQYNENLPRRILDTIKNMKNNPKLILTLKIILLLIICEIMFLTFYMGTNKKIYKGVKAYGIDVGGLTKTEASEKLSNELSSEVISKKVTIYYNDYFEKSFDLNDVILSLDYDKIASSCKNVGRSGSLFKRISDVMKARRGKIDVNLKYTVDLTKLRNIIYDLKYEVDKEGIDATFEKEHGSDFVITKEQYGIELNVAKSIDIVQDAIENNKLEENNNKILLSVNELRPAVTLDNIKAYSKLLSSFQTEYRRSDEKRLKKLMEISSILDKSVIQSNNVFSYNEIMGITPSKESETIGTDDNDECNVQLATTLYNAVILSNLEIVERTNVDYLPSYVDIGRDCLVYGNMVDFKFKNNTTNPIYIESYVTNGKLIVRIYGNENFKIYDNISFKHNIYDVVMPEETIETYDESLQDDEIITTQVGESGFSVDVYVTYKVLGKEDIVKKLPSSTYMPKPTRILTGDISKIDNNNDDNIEVSNTEDTKENNKERETNQSNDIEQINEDSNNVKVTTQGKIVIGKAGEDDTKRN